MATTGTSVHDTGLELDVERGSVGCATVALHGELDLFTAAALRQTLGELLASGRTMVTLDLTGLSFIDSAGHRSIGTMADLAEGLGGAVRLGGCSPRVRHFLDLTTSILVVPTGSAAILTDVDPSSAQPPRAVGF
jgi:anti-sigma B factor antagonist